MNGKYRLRAISVRWCVVRRNEGGGQAAGKRVNIEVPGVEKLLPFWIVDTGCKVILFSALWVESVL